MTFKRQPNSLCQNPPRSCFSGSASTTGGSADAVNNVESVFLPAGTSGSFTVTVTATNSAGVSAASEPSNQVTVEPDPTPTPTETPTPVVTDTYVPIDYPTYVDSTTSDTLARTGAFDIKAFVLAGVGSIAVGTLLLTLSRRRRRGQHESR